MILKLERCTCRECANIYRTVFTNSHGRVLYLELSIADESYVITDCFYIERNQIEVRVTHESYTRQGVERKPQIHLGRAVCAMEERGIHTERGNQNRDIMERNRLQDERRRNEREQQRDCDLGLYRYR